MTSLFLMIFACGTTTVALVEDCDVLGAGIEPQEAPAGAIVTAEVTPVTTHWDTAVYVNGVRAEVGEILREGCEACDTCKETNACLACDDCDDCDATCKADCNERIAFTVPNIPAGPAQVVIYNGHGTTDPIAFTVSASADTGEADTGSSSTDSGGDVDTGTR